MTDGDDALTMRPTIPDPMLGALTVYLAFRARYEAEGYSLPLANWEDLPQLCQDNFKTAYVSAIAVAMAGVL